MGYVAWKTLLSCQHDDIDDLVQNRSVSSALAMEILQSCTKPLTCHITENSILGTPSYLQELFHSNHVR